MWCLFFFSFLYVWLGSEEFYYSICIIVQNIHIFITFSICLNFFVSLCASFLRLHTKIYIFQGRRGRCVVFPPHKLTSLKKCYVIDLALNYVLPISHKRRAIVGFCRNLRTLGRKSYRPRFNIVFRFSPHSIMMQRMLLFIRLLYKKTGFLVNKG